MCMVLVIPYCSIISLLLRAVLFFEAYRVIDRDPMSANHNLTPAIADVWLPIANIHA